MANSDEVSLGNQHDEQEENSREEGEEESSEEDEDEDDSDVDNDMNGSNDLDEDEDEDEEEDESSSEEEQSQEENENADAVGSQAGLQQQGPALPVGANGEGHGAQDPSEDTSDDSYRPPVRALRRSARLAHAGSGRDSGGAPESSQPTQDTAVLQAEVRAMRAERDLARNEAVTERLNNDQLKADNRALLEERDHLLAQMEQLREEHAGACRDITGRTPSTTRCGELVKLLNKPAIFDGKDTGKTKIIDWLLAFKQWLVAVEANPVHFVSTAESYLREEAMRFWLKRKALMSPEQQQSWDAFASAMRERFDAENTAEAARIKLDRLKQGGSSMAKFVAEFDNISSYIDDISDKDLIHRFLEAVSSQHRSQLRNNPTVGGPWEVYAHLRKYALSMFPEEARPAFTMHKPPMDKSSRHNKRAHRSGAGVLQSAYEMARKKTKMSTGGGSSGAGPSSGGNSDWKDFTNAAGDRVQRTAAQRNAIFRARICAYCYKPGHSSPECKAKFPAKGDPPSK